MKAMFLHLSFIKICLPEQETLYLFSLYSSGIADKRHMLYACKDT